MALGKRLFTGGTAACLTETTDIFGGSTGKALYSMDYDASDTSGVYDGTPTDVDFGVGGQINTGARFNGSSSIITATQPSGINGPCSYSIWLKTTSSSYQSIITVGSVTGSHTAGVNLFVNSGKLSCQTGNGSNTENTTLNSTSNVDTGNWVHCVVTVAGSTQGSAIKIYVNKTNETSGTANNTAIVTATGEKLCLGGRILSGSQSTFLNGSLDQARIFTSELSAANVTSLYNEKPETDTSNFKAVLYKGTNASQYISNVGMDLETSGGLVWLKNRTGTNSHALIDSVRGRAKYLYSDDTFAENSSGASNDLTSFEKNGFFVGSVSNAGSVNTSGGSIVGWVWKGGGTPVSNSNGANITSSVSANTAAGFSIVSYTGTSTIGDTIGHGLGTPDLIIVKNRDNSSASWAVWSSTFSAASETLLLDATSPSNQYTNRFGTVNSTTFQAGSSGGTEVNASGNKFIAYIFKNVTGYQKIGSYSGGSSGKQITGVGFKPNFLAIKRTDSAGGWRVQDVRRKGTSGTNKNVLEWNDPAIEQVNYVDVSFDTDGFTLNTTNNDYNNSSGTYIYLAIK